MQYFYFKTYCYYYIFSCNQLDIVYNTFTQEEIKFIDVYLRRTARATINCLLIKRIFP